jgi:hypothetical protein
MKRMKGEKYGLMVLFALLAGLVIGLLLGQHGSNGTANAEQAASVSEDEGTPAIPPNINNEKTLYSEEKNVTTQHVVRANRFELADDKGLIRAVLGLNQEGEPRLALADESGRILVALSLELDYKFTKDKIPALRFFDRAGKARNEMNINRMGDPVLILRNQRGGTIAMLTGTDKTGTEWVLMDPQGRPRITQNVNRNGANLSFFDEGIKARAGLGVKPDGNPGLIFSDDKMKNRVTLGYAEDTMTNKGSKESGTVSSLVLFDKNGKVLWKAP